MAETDSSSSSSTVIPASVAGACRAGSVQVIETYFKDKANLAAINAHAEDAYYTLLHVAAESGHMKIIELLLKSGALPCCTSEDGQTPLHLAAASGHLAAVQALTKGNCPELMLEDKYQMTAFHLACENGSHSVVRYFMSMVQINPSLRRGSARQASQRGCQPESRFYR